MSLLRRFGTALLLTAIAAAAPAALAADPEGTAADPEGTAAAQPPTATTTGEYSDRLFLGFAQQAALVPSQWWEAQVEFQDGNSDIPVDVFLVRGVVAFHPVKSLEVGGRVGFGSTDSPGPNEGTGATDLDVYGKWVWLDAGAHLDFSAGMLLTIPTGDDSVGLGFDSFGGQAFGAIRYRFDEIEVGGHLGIRANGDGGFQGSNLDGKTSFGLNLFALFPLASQVSLVAEGQFESDRFEGVDGPSEILAGVNWRAFGRGILRGAVGAGLSSGSPDFRVLFSYAYTF